MADEELASYRLQFQQVLSVCFPFIIHQPDRPANAGLPGFLWRSARIVLVWHISLTTSVTPHPMGTHVFSYLSNSRRQSTHSMAAGRPTNFFPTMCGSRNTPHPDEDRS
ncbi:hypothetical protein Y032_0076g1021 [Ancylostoma ceylanicum]|uniref:Uncharacterized protein n=1 Tax=Ancylostoma ceylanicum TaxID=53326 RepID=A0A016TUC5_9BILA|nr:hypothetical protein Y032_0076g1021 [Ancylostoma ceylanicum]